MGETFKGTPPGFHSSATSPRTVALRPPLSLSVEQITAARRMRRRGAEPPAIAAELDHPEDAVERALLAMRTAKPDRTRWTLNVTSEAGVFVCRERVGEEPIWQTVDRLIAELIERRGA